MGGSLIDSENVGGLKRTLYCMYLRIFKLHGSYFLQDHETEKGNLTETHSTF